jgi:hypothetical protein
LVHPQSIPHGIAGSGASLGPAPSSAGRNVQRLGEVLGDRSLQDVGFDVEVVVDNAVVWGRRDHKTPASLSGLGADALGCLADDLDGESLLAALRC